MWMYFECLHYQPLNIVNIDAHYTHMEYMNVEFGEHY